MSSFSWQERISPLQRGLLKVSALVGFLIFFGALQMSVRGKGEIWSWIAGFGMFVAAEMRWGLQGLYNTVEDKWPNWLERFGYANFFWLFFGVALVVNMFGLIGILFIATDYLATGELPFGLLSS